MAYEKTGVRISNINSRGIIEEILKKFDVAGSLWETSVENNSQRKINGSDENQDEN